MLTLATHEEDAWWDAVEHVRQDHAVEHISVDYTVMRVC